MNSMSSFFGLRSLSVSLCIWLVAGCGHLFGQTVLGGQVQSLEVGDLNALGAKRQQGEMPELLRGFAGEEVPTVGEGTLDQTVDPQRYILGPGDRLSVYAWGEIQKQFTLSVNSEGKVVIPRIGVVDVRGRSLAAGRQMLREEILKSLKDVELTITLVRIREFRTHVLGQVRNPGVYKADGMTRASDVIEMAGGLRIDAKHRGVEVWNDDSLVRLVDLNAFHNSNVLDSDPYLAVGDRVFVPSRKEIVSVYGEVCFPSTFDYMHGDSLISLIRAAGGLSRDADSTRILLSRFVDNRDSLRHLYLSLSDERSFPMRPDDRIMVCRVPEYRVHREVTIAGEVHFPGTYAIQRQQTRLRDVIEMAGGLTEDASLRASTVIRMQKDQDGSVPPQVRFDVMKLIDSRDYDVDPSEISYVKSELLDRNNRIVVDFDEAMDGHGGVDNIVLRDGDSIFVAERRLRVRVMGAVVSPGLVGFQSRARPEYYIRQAGGFSRRARKNGVLVKKVGTDVWVKDRNVDCIGPGDTILVSEKRFRDRFVFTKDLLAIIGSIGTIALSFVTIGNVIAQ